jgi:hypothetical protein
MKKKNLSEFIDRNKEPCSSHNAMSLHYSQFHLRINIENTGACFNCRSCGANRGRHFISGDASEPFSNSVTKHLSKQMGSLLCKTEKTCGLLHEEVLKGGMLPGASLDRERSLPCSIMSFQAAQGPSSRNLANHTTCRRR